MKKLIFLSAGMFTMGCSSYIIAGLLPGIGSTLNTSIAATGQGITAFGATYVVCAPIFAVLLAKQPARLILLISLTIFAIGNVLTLLSTNFSLYLFSRAIAGAGAGLYSPICVAVAVQLVGSEARGRALSMVWGANSAGAVIGVPLGLWLSEKYGWQASIGLILAFALFSFLGIAIKKVELNVKALPSLRERLRLLIDHRVLSVIGITCITATGSLGLYSYVSAMHFGVTNSLMSVLFVWSLGGLIGSNLVGYVVDSTRQPRQVMAVILAILMVSIFLLPILHSLPIIGLLPFFIWGAMGWATVTPQQHILIGLQPTQGATLAALNGSALSLGGVLGAAFGGLLIASEFDARNLPYMAATLLLFAFLWQLLLIKQSPKEVAV